MVKVNEKVNAEVSSHLDEFPTFTLKCRLGEVLKERGISMVELSQLTGIRPATLSELVNMKRSTVSVPHLLVIAKVLRITDISQLFEFKMSLATELQFGQDQSYIEVNGLLPDQDEILSWIRKEKKLIEAFRRKVNKQKKTTSQ